MLKRFKFARGKKSPEAETAAKEATEKRDVLPSQPVAKNEKAIELPLGTEDAAMDNIIRKAQAMNLQNVQYADDSQEQGQLLQLQQQQLQQKQISDPSNWKLTDFEVGRTLGTGTFGRVRICRQKGTGQYYAMKILKKKQIIRLKQVEHIMSEKNILSRLDHPFIIKLYKTFSDEKNLYMIMEYSPGGEMFSHLRKAGKFENDVAKFYAAQIVLAFDYLHRQNIVYRDLKPENLLLDNNGHIKITDFGFAKVVTERTYTLCGTPEYLAPEIIQSKGHNKAVDWWALGVLIYEMLVGYPPFFDETPFRIYEKILEGRIDFPRFIDPNAKDLIRRLLTIDRTKRIGNLKGGTEDILNHKWFRNIDWEAMYNKRYSAPIPVRVSSPGDSHYYEEYENSIETTEGPLLTPEQHALFKDF